MSTANRPLSPHLQVYRPQLTSILSISHRLTGIVLGIGALFLVCQLVAAASGPDAFERIQGFAGSWLGLVLLFGWSASFFYHLANGIRHLVWDAGYGLDIETTYRSGRMVVVATVVLTAAAWIAALIVKGAQ
jgi:succinate dehydrogenase / fumarate reductase cytochrome b subunit